MGLVVVLMFIVACAPVDDADLEADLDDLSDAELEMVLSDDASSIAGQAYSPKTSQVKAAIKKTSAKIPLECIELDNGILLKRGSWEREVLDICKSNGVTLYDRYCKSSGFSSHFVNCENGCVDGACVEMSTPENAVQLACDAVYQDEEYFYIGETLFRYKGADRVHQQNPIAKFQYLETGETHEKSIIFNEFGGSFELKYAGVTYNFRNASSVQSDDWAIQFVCEDCEPKTECVYQDYAGGIKECGIIGDGCGGTINCNYQAYAGGLECPQGFECQGNQCWEVEEESFCYYVDKQTGEQYTRYWGGSPSGQGYESVITENGTFSPYCDGENRAKSRCGIPGTGNTVDRVTDYGTFFIGGEGVALAETAQLEYCANGCNADTNNCCQFISDRSWCNGNYKMNATLTDCGENVVPTNCSELNSGSYIFTCFETPDDAVSYWNTGCSRCGVPICEQDGVKRVGYLDYQTGQPTCGSGWTPTGELVTGPGCPSGSSSSGGGDGSTYNTTNSTG